MTFEDCLNLALRILPLLPQVPMDVSYEMQIPLIIAYYPESSVYRRWHAEHGGVSPFCKEVRASRTLTKVLGGIHCQNSEGVDHTPSPAISDGSAGSDRSQSITSHRSRQSGSAYSWTTKDDKESISRSEPSHVEEGTPHDDEYAEVCEGDGEVLSDGQAASDGEEGLGDSPTWNTHSGVSHVFGTHKETDGESDHEEGTPPKWQKWCQPSPKEETSSHESEESSSSKEEQPTNEALRDRCQQQAWHMDTNFDAWWHKKITKGLPGWAARDTMICNLPEHGKVQPNHPDLVGLPLEYMRDCQAFEGIPLDLYDLCQFYALGMTGDPPKFPAPREPATHRQIQDLLKSAHTIGRSYLIMAHSADSVMAVSLLKELHTATCLRWLQVNLQDKSVKLFFYPLCAYVGGNDLSYLNHIIIAHYNVSYGCGRCLKQVFVSSLALHTHKKVCLGFPSKKASGVPDSKPKSGRGNSRHRASSKATPKKDGKGGTAANSQGLSAPSASQTSPCRSRRGTSHHHKSKKDDGENGKRQLARVPPKRVEGTRLTRMGLAAKWAPRRHPQLLCFTIKTLIQNPGVCYNSFYS